MKEYKVLYFWKDITESVEEALNDFCNNGWIVVSINITEDTQTKAWITLVKEF